MRLISSILFSVCLTSNTFAAETGIYKIPSGDFLDSDLFLLSDNIQWKERSDGTIRFDYKLPQEIDGASPKKIVLRSINRTSPLLLAGPDATASCKVINRDVECSIEYEKNDNEIFQVDTVAANQFMEASGYSLETIQLMQKGQQSIMHEAAGVMKFRKRR